MLQKQRSIGDINTAGRVLRFPLSLPVWIKAALEEGEEEAGSASHLSNVPQWLRSTTNYPHVSWHKLHQNSKQRRDELYMIRDCAHRRSRS